MEWRPEALGTFIFSMTITVAFAAAMFALAAVVATGRTRAVLQ
jgi:hypothetical protein